MAKLNGIELEKVKVAAESILRLNELEIGFLKTYLSMAAPTTARELGAWIDPGVRASPPVSTVRTRRKVEKVEKPDPKLRGPDKRGTYKCRKCGERLSTKRGRSIHYTSVHGPNGWRGRRRPEEIDRPADGETKEVES